MTDSELCFHCEEDIFEETSIRMGESDDFICHKCCKELNIEFDKKISMQETTEAPAPKISLESVKDNYVKNRNGAIFQIIEDKKNHKKMYLRSRNKYISKYVRDIKQGLVTGEWLSVNIGELRSWIADDNAYIEKLTQKLLKRVILTQLLLELDDELLVDYENNPNFRNHLNKSNKAAERIASKQYDRLYGLDKTILQNLMNEVDELTEKMASLEISEFIHLNRLMDKYKANPDTYREKVVEFIKIQE